MEALRRAVRILETFRDGNGTRTVEEIAHKTEIPLSTCYRYVSEMVDLGFLTPSTLRRDSFTVGATLTELLAGFDPHQQLERVARPYLVDLQRVTGQHTQLAVLEGTSVVYVEKLSSTRAVDNITGIGQRMPACLNSSGILLLAEAGIDRAEAARDVDEIAHYIETLPHFASARVPSVQNVRDAATAARRKGYCELDSWLGQGISGLAAPVRNPDGVAVAAVSVIMPNDRAAVRRVVPLLRFTGINISRALANALRGGDTAPGVAGAAPSAFDSRGA